ncbi:MAG: SOS response-associated peptidase [Deltaproteobacteria bacterium]|nr:SOS response-associated peptidase [Kofleriaceae bacterium]
MCGRYSSTRQDQLVAEMALAIADDPGAGVLAVAPGFPAGLTSWWAPRWNIAPTQPAPVVVMREAVATLCLMRWGLVPHWADDLSIGARHINARAETAAGKPAFRDALRRRRCLVSADGFYEWQKEGKRRIPFAFGPANAAPVTFAGIWDRWKARDGEGSIWVESFSILTTTADPLVAPLHDRMPVVVPAADRARWLSGEELPPEALADLLASHPLAGWERREAEPWVNAATRERGAAAE